jgi:hypothetical protein
MKCYNWYKTAGGFSSLLSRIYPEVSYEQFQSMTWREKQSLGWNKALSPEVQRLFFTGDYVGKAEALGSLARNLSITPEIQKLFFTEGGYEGKSHVLEALAENKTILTQTQLMFFKPEYWINGFPALYYLANNTSITSLTQRMFFAAEYPDKNGVISYIKRNPIFLKGLTLQDMREIIRAKEARYFIYDRRLKQIKEKIGMKVKK